MPGSYWSIEGCCWEPAPGVPDALTTPWSAHGLPVPVLPYPASAAEVLRLPSRAAQVADALPEQRTQAGQPVPL